MDLTRLPQWPLFKYTTVSEYTIQNLMARQLYAASPSSFNDPFEFVLPENAARLLLERASERVSFLKGNPVISGEVTRLVQWFAQEISKMGVVCFTTKCDNLLMWSHYADHHRGICIGFSDDEPPNRSALFPVLYSDTRVTIDEPELWHARGLSKLLSTKHSAWAYEEEFRMLRVEKGPMTYPGKLSEVIFGFRTSSEDKNRVRRAVGEDPNVKYYQMALCGTTFALLKTPL